MGFEPTVSWATTRCLQPLGYGHLNALIVPHAALKGKSGAYSPASSMIMRTIR